MDGPPARSFSGGSALIADRRAAVGRWQGKELIMVDLDGDEATETGLATFEEPVAWAMWGTHGGVVSLESGRKAVIDTLGRTIASGDGEITLLHRQLAVVQRGKTFESIHLDEDPLLRSRSPLELSGEWYFTMDPHRDGLFAYRDTDYVELAADGHALRRGSREDGRTPYLPWSPGRWFIRCGRIFPKSMSECSIQSRLHPSDAWVAGRSMIILGRDGWITVSGRKHGEFTELPQVVLGDHFARVTGKDDLLCMDGANRTHAVLTLAPNPTVSDVRGAQCDDLPPGPWQVGQMKFTIPHGPACEWDAAKTGFVPERLRSPKDSPYLIAVTASLVLMLDPAAAKVFARK
ncbi:MAG: hypothetical protein H0W83_15880 [Planctomycetes bacterium]|nr:hypothetical protein [Planctomycetota bacterium]